MKCALSSAFFIFFWCTLCFSVVIAKITSDDIDCQLLTNTAASLSNSLITVNVSYNGASLLWQLNYPNMIATAASPFADIKVSEKTYIK